MASVAVEVAVGLGQGNQFRGSPVGVEGEGAVLFGKAEIFGDLRGEGSAVGLFFQQLWVNGGGLGVLGVGGAGWVVLLLPALGGVEIDEGEGDLLFGSAAFGADVMDDVADDAVAHDDLVAAVLEDEAGAVRGRVVRLESGGVLWQSVERLWRADGGGEENCGEFWVVLWINHLGESTV